MTCARPPFANAVLAEATRIAPARRTSSDGVCGDARHQAEASDHNPSGPNNYAHAVDISQDARLFDAHAYGYQIAKRIASGVEKRVKYLVSFDGTKDVIFNPSVGMYWRQNGTAKTEHANHLHVSFTVAAEQSVAPFFLLATPEVDMLDDTDLRKLRNLLFTEDPNHKGQHVGAIAEAFDTYLMSDAFIDRLAAAVAARVKP